MERGKREGSEARGGFTVDMDWNGGQLSSASVTSGIGGVLRIRSYVPLKGEGLSEAEGICPNPLYAPATVADAIVSEETQAQHPILFRTYEYDLNTQPGMTYQLQRKR